MPPSPLFRCPCGYGPKSRAAIHGHQRHHKTPECSGEMVRVSEGPAPAEQVHPAFIEDEVRAESSGFDPDPAEPDPDPGPPPDPEPRYSESGAWPGSADANSLAGNGHGAASVPPVPTYPPVARATEGGEQKEVVKIVTPSTVKPQVVLPMSIFVWYDAWRAHFAYEGNIDQWLTEVVDHYMDLAGFELTLTARRRETAEVA